MVNPTMQPQISDAQKVSTRDRLCGEVPQRRRRALLSVGAAETLTARWLDEQAHDLRKLAKVIDRIALSYCDGSHDFEQCITAAIGMESIAEDLEHAAWQLRLVPEGA